MCGGRSVSVSQCPRLDGQSSRLRLLLALLCAVVLWVDSVLAHTPPTRRQLRCGGEVVAPLAAQAAVEAPPSRFLSSQSIDLLIAYTPSVVTRVGSLEATLDEIRSIVAYANAAHENSGTGVHFSLVYIHPLTTEESGTFLTDLDAAAASDGVWDELLTLREQYRADMVSVVVPGTQGGRLCGLAYTNGLTGNFASSAPYMYSIVSVAPACTPSTLAHELGHNLGSQHDQRNASSVGWQSYSFGYTFTGGSRQRWQTVMAVASNHELPFFSTPLLSFDSVPLGDSTAADNARSLALAAPEVAAIYTSLGGEDLSAAAPPEPDAVALRVRKVAGGKRLRITAVVTSAGVPRGYRSAALYWSRGRRGTQTLGAIGRTNSRGELSTRITARILPTIFYQGCDFGSAAVPVCSVKVNVVRAAR